ncbi:MAG: GNAT family N-acetyltransferase, partial [Helicobacteraceae bacterium]|nr:GNAT family N-acetyltransferase [Helicobacteraceae bacterium]
MIYLQTDRLIIRDNREDDLQGLYELTIDEENMRFMKSTKINSYEEAIEHLKASIDESKKIDRKKYYFAIINKKTNEYIGAIGYDVLDNRNNERIVELGYFIKKEYWGNGFVVEAGKKVINYAFYEDNVIKIEASCLKENNNSEKVMIKLGMKKEGELRKHQYHEGKWKDRLLYG